MKHLKSLSYFLAVAQHKSIREAAETVHVTSTALNRHILDLEEKLGAPLFERHARGVRLTSAGETYLDYAKRAQRDAEAAQSSIDELRGVKRGQIALATIAAVAEGDLMESIHKFQKRYPRIAFTVTVQGSEAVVDSVLRLDCDLGIAFNPAAGRDFRELASTVYTIHAVVGSGHAAAKRDTVSIHELIGQPLAIADRSWGGRRVLDEFLAKTGLRIQPHLVSNSFDVLKEFVRRTGGACFQIRPGARREVIANDLVAVPVTELRRYERRMVLGGFRERVLPVAAALFAEQIRRDLFTDVKDRS